MNRAFQSEIVDHTQMVRDRAALRQSERLAALRGPSNRVFVRCPALCLGESSGTINVRVEEDAIVFIYRAGGLLPLSGARIGGLPSSRSPEDGQQRNHHKSALPFGTGLHRASLACDGTIEAPSQSSPGC
jgi:hypothetical protein